MTSNKFEDLQRKAKRIQLISLLKKFFLLGIFLSLVTVVYSFYFVKEEVPILAAAKSEEMKVEVKSEPVKEVNITSTKVIITEPKKELVIEKDLHVNKDLHVEYDTVVLRLSIPTNENEKIALKKATQDKTVQEEIIFETQDEPKTSNFVMQVKSADKEDILIRDFSTNKNFESAIGLASIYFEKRNFKKAVFWSKEASRIQPESSKPWIIYAKAKHELGIDKDAIKALENYLSFFSSREARDFLETLRKVKK